MDRLLIHILAGAIPGAVILLLAIFLIVRCCCRRRRQLPSTTTIPFTETETTTKSLDSFHASLHKLHLSYKSSTSKSSLRFHHLHQPHNHPDPQQPITQQWIPFNWNDHPELIDEVAEHGWARFAFTSRPAAASKPSTPLLGLCTVCDVGSQKDMTEVDWKLPAGAPELMQTIRLKSTTKKAEDFASICMSLPLPGPRLGGSSFPQEAYFEITILVLQPQQRRKSSRRGGGDRPKLMQENSTTALVPSPLQDTKSAHEEDVKQSDCLISLGFAVGESSSSNKWMPGTYPGSIGFCSNGSIHLDGMKLVFESERGEWAGVNRVIGCGFNPSKKKVFLTVDSELVHVISCNSDVYKSPLYPVVAAAKADVMVLINLGQRPFKYAPANASRTANPCFIRSPSQDVGPGYFHSRELFLMGRISTEECIDITRGSNSKKGDDCRVDIDADSELFEISLNR